MTQADEGEPPRLVPKSYAAVPIRAIRDRRLKRKDWAVLAALCYHADTRGYCFPSQERIAALTGLSRQTVNECVQRLHLFGYLKIVKPSKEVRRPSGRFAVNGYVVVRKPLEGEKALGKSDSHVTSAGDTAHVTPGADNSMSPPVPTQTGH